MTENIAQTGQCRKRFCFQPHAVAVGPEEARDWVKPGRCNLGGTFHHDENIKHSTSCSRAVILKRRFFYSSDTTVVAISRASRHRLVLDPCYIPARSSPRDYSEADPPQQGAININLIILGSTIIGVAVYRLSE